MTTQSIRIHTASSDETRRLGTMVGRELSNPAFIGLTGDLGSGKTVFVQGLARGLEVPERYAVTSPTYTFINEYPGRLTLFHVDLYRISHVDELTDIGFDDLTDDSGVVVVEWAERLPQDFHSFNIKIFLDMTGDDTRTCRFFFYGRPSMNLIRDLKHNFNTDEA